MIAELGIFFLILTLIISSFGFVIPLFNLFNRIEITQKKISELNFLCTFLAFFLLTYCFATSDFSLNVVERNSNSQLPLIYKITGVWGNHEGSILLWLCCFFCYFFNKKDRQKFKRENPNIQNSLIFVISLFIILTSTHLRTFPLLLTVLI